MKRLLFLTLFLGALTALTAQRPGGGGFQRPQGPTITGRISGVLLDSVTRSPIEFATVVLIDPRKDEQIDGIVTDIDGSFKLTEVKNGTYHVRFDFLGYEPRTLTGVELTLEKPDVDLGDLLLTPESLLLQEVTVTGERSVIENKIDKIVYNAEKDVTTQGGDATDVLQRVPLLAVDIDGNVSLRGSSNVQILINGKPSTLFTSGSLADALKTFPADQIKAVEVITAPTAKYDGEGTAGIINIVTKKKSIEGFTGSLNGSLGTRSNRGSLSLNYARGRFGINSSFSGWYNWPRESYADFYRESYVNGQQSAPLILDQDTDGRSNFYGPRASVGAFYDINAYNSLNSSLTFRGFGRNNEGTTNSFFGDPTDAVEDQVYSRDNISRSLRSGFDWTTDYRRTFKQPEKELSFALQISGDISTSRNEVVQTGNFDFLGQDQVNENDGLNLEYTFQTDFAQPLGKAVKLETGAKAVIRRIDSDFSFRFRDPDAGGEYVIDPNQTDIFYYDQDVYAGYLQFNVELGDKYGLVAGARYEHTAIGGDFDEDPTTFTNDYDNILPSIIFSRKLNQFSSLKVSYSKRIQRPSLRFVNPYVDISDPRDISFGNPEVLPELNDQYELSYNTYIKGVVLNAAVYYRNTTDGISNVTTVLDDVTQTTYQNIGQERSLGFNFFTSFKIKQWLQLRGGYDLRRFEAEGLIQDRLVSRTAYIWRANLNGTADLGNDFKVEMFGFFNSPRQTLQGFRGAYSQFSIGFNKEMWDKRGSLGLSIIQPFSRILAFPSEIQGPDFFQDSEFGVVVRSFNVNFSYRFGKLDFKQPRRRGSAINNDDLKEGGGNEGF